MSVIGSNVLAGASGQAVGAAGYEITRSLRFNSADSAYCSRVFPSNGDLTKWSWSGWVKLGNLNNGGIFSAGTDNTNYFRIYYFGASSVATIQFVHVISGAIAAQVRTAAVFRDPSAWYHIVYVWDSANGTASDRQRVYINGVRADVTNETIPAQGAQSYGNRNVAHYIGCTQNAILFFDGYLADVHFIDGQALDPTDFGEYDDNNVWQPKAYSGTYGTNGFHLDFSDNSSASALGTDSSGNSNTWTVNNLSVASGAGNDSLIDTPTNYEAASGNNGGNYATFNPLSEVTTTAPSNGNLDNTLGSTSSGTILVNSGKWYVEYTVGTIDTGRWVGFGLPAHDSDLAQLVIYREDGFQYNGTAWVSYGSTYAAGDIIAVAIDLDGNTVEFYKNGTSQGSLSRTLTKAVTFVATHTGSVNFGQRPFAYTPPTGFLSLCTANLTDPTIADGSTAMDVVTYAGNGSTQTISGLDFSPDLVWIKQRTANPNPTAHILQDTVRGLNKTLSSDQTYSELTNNYLTSFNSDGFGVDGTSYYTTNGSSATYVAWTWDGGTSTVSNTDGSVTSSVRANASAGFSIVTYTGSGSGTATIGHGLNAAPELILVKGRNFADNWWVQHVSEGHTKVGFLNLTNAFGSSSLWGSAPTSSVFSISSSGNSSYNYVAYCFAPVEGYSAFGSYTGNGSADGPFVYTGFRPRWILIKSSSISPVSQWGIWDTERNTYNVTNSRLSPNTSGAEITTAAVALDVLSNGFKPRTTDYDSNQSGDTYIYAAFAEHPFKTARAR